MTPLISKYEGKKYNVIKGGVKSQSPFTGRARTTVSQTQKEQSNM